MKINYDKQDDWYFKNGKMQSPIEIISSRAKTSSEKIKLIFDYALIFPKPVLTKPGIQVPASGQARIYERNFQLKQFHFHFPSEHLIDKKQYPAEIHFVHQAQNGRLAVVAVFIEESVFSKNVQLIIDSLKNSGTEPKKLDPRTLMPTKKHGFHYLGSLTTPPLSENVEWYLLKDPIQASSEQIKALKKSSGFNQRHLQDINQRTIIQF
ncbi:carbonic anhydrase family protein [Oenococcus alcoholitolerans]|uniref:carbonic anhydrase family protein n=1 Tax=Oenococcus alcoholitolerans TaxID=931074 RepID=UPI003F70E4A5